MTPRLRTERTTAGAEADARLTSVRWGGRAWTPRRGCLQTLGAGLLSRPGGREGCRRHTSPCQVKQSREERDHPCSESDHIDGDVAAPWRG